MSPFSSADAIPDVPDLTADDFSRVRRIASEHAGLAIPDGKEGLMRARLGKRLGKLVGKDFSKWLG